MTVRPQENVVNNIALLPLPEPPRWCITGAEQKTELCTWADNYARANVDAAVIHLRAELRSEMATTKQLRRELDEAEAALASAQAREDELRAEVERLAELWSDRQCAEFMSVAMRHCNVRGTFSWDDIRMGQSRAQALRGNDGEEQP